MAENSSTNEQPKSSQNMEPEPPSQNQKKIVKTILIAVGVLTILGIIGIVILGYGLNSIFDEATEGVTVSDEGVSIEREGEDFSFSTNTELADDFPESVPIYPESELSSTSRNQEADTRIWSANFLVEATPTEAFEFYENELERNSWETVSTFESGDVSTISAEKSDENLTLTIGISEADGRVSINMTAGQESEIE